MDVVHSYSFGSLTIETALDTICRMSYIAMFLQYGLTPLMMATSNGKVEAANVLLEAGADVNLQSNDVSIRTLYYV